MLYAMLCSRTSIWTDCPSDDLYSSCDTAKNNLTDPIERQTNDKISRIRIPIFNILFNNIGMTLPDGTALGITRIA
jgi:hypothetical protein